MAENYKGFVITEKRIASSIGRAGSAFKSVYLITDPRTGEIWKRCQSLMQAYQGIDTKIVGEDQDA